ncbi:unnamed protein product [marine sediment metagenome]|uniref:Uncharacterized protein n=1 Tax=marine sediment metagenome TaxID=412755 RepID=X0VMF5_9ZZZZ
MSFIRVQCKGETLGCERCRNLFKDRGFCKECGRALWKSVGEKCDIAYAYVERNYTWQGKIRIKCRFCKFINII